VKTTLKSYKERQGQKIVVEIKSFIGRSLMYDFHGALGQYIVSLFTVSNDYATDDRQCAKNMHPGNRFAQKQPRSNTAKNRNQVID
jgi:hypothetical protein